MSIPLAPRTGNEVFVMALHSMDRAVDPTIVLPDNLSKDRLLGVQQVATLMNFSVAHVRRLYSTDKMPKPIKIGGKKLAWKAGVILAFIDGAPQREVA